MAREHRTVAPLSETGDDAQSRIDDALHTLATYEGDDILGLMLHLVAVLNGAAPRTGPGVASGSLVHDQLRQRLADRLTAAWPRMDFGGHALDVADTALQVIQPVVTQLRVEAATWRDSAERAVRQRDGARAIAITLEQTTAEAVRLLRAGQPGPALAVLESDGRPLGHEGVHDNGSMYADPSAEGEPS